MKFISENIEFFFLFRLKAPNFASMFGSFMGGAAGGASGGPDLMSLLNNPALMNMVCN